LYVQSQQKLNLCPSCNMPSSRVHSRYWRVIQDVTIFSLQIFLDVRARKFFCDHSACSQRIFTEQTPDWWSPYARRTSRLTAFLKHLASETARKVSKQYGIPTSADSFLYLIRKEEIPPITEPTIIGIDDWDVKKGHNTEVSFVTYKPKSRWRYWKIERYKRCLTGCESILLFKL
jgi:transposase